MRTEEGIRLAAFDIDGTIRTPEGIPEPVQRGLHHIFQEEGVIKAVSTGRGWPWVPETVKDGFTQVELDTALHVCENGGRITLGGENLLYNRLPPNDMEPVVEAWAYGLLQRISFFPETPGSNPINIEAPETGPRMRHERVRTLLFEARPTMVYARPVEPGSVNLFPPEMNATLVDRGVNYHINPPGIHKGSGIERVADIYGIDHSQVAVFGNDANDVGALNNGFGLSVFVGDKETHEQFGLSDKVRRVEDIEALGAILQIGLNAFAATDTLHSAV